MKYEYFPQNNTMILLNFTCMQSVEAQRVGYSIVLAMYYVYVVVVLSQYLFEKGN